MGEEYYPCSLSRAQRVSTSLCIVILVPVSVVVAGVAVFSLAAMVNGKAEAIVIIPVLPAVALLPVLLAVLPRYAPVGVSVGPKGIAVVRRNGNRIALHAKEIMSVEPQPRSVLRRTIRAGGVGGYFGSWGRFYNPTLKSFRAYMTDVDHLVAVRTRTQGVILLTPDDPEGFVEKAERELGLVVSRGK